MVPLDMVFSVEPENDVDIDAIANPAAYAFGALRRYGNYDDVGLPPTYERLRGTHERRLC